MYDMVDAVLKAMAKVAFVIIFCVAILVINLGWDTESTNTYIYSGTEVSLTSPYARFINVNQAKIWDHQNATLSTTATYTNTDVALTNKSESTDLGGWLVDVDQTDKRIPNGMYDMLIYDNATPAYGDIPILGYRIRISNGEISEMIPL